MLFELCILVYLAYLILLGIFRILITLFGTNMEVSGLLYDLLLLPFYFYLAYSTLIDGDVMV